MSEVLDLVDLRASLAKFAEEVPKILRGQRLTEEFASQLLRSLAMTESPFTLAVVGQMRVGKSTLINSLVGDDLAIPGVTETTATVNWFRHGTREQADTFRAVWDDAFGTADVFPLGEKERWSGNSELAARTRYLEFYGQADFLRRVHVVDTPGTRSTLESHEATARGFLLEEGRAERDTTYYGGAADCVVYVLPPIVRQNDSETLGAFRAQSRFLQSTPFNSVGVLHKWETLDQPEPLSVAVAQARRAFASLKAYVCDVIPVSGPLARAAQVCPCDFWEGVLELVRGSSAEALEDLTEREGTFFIDLRDCPVGPEARKRLYEQSRLPWPCFKTLLLIAAAERCDSGEKLRTVIMAASGIERLLDFLERRFFARAELIRSANVLERALRIADAARGRLRNRLAGLDDDCALGSAALEEIGAREVTSNAKDFIERRLDEVAREGREAFESLRRLESETRSVRQAFLRFEKDRRAVRTLDEFADQFDSAQAEEMLSLLGAYGTGLEQRLGAMPEEERSGFLAQRLDAWLVRRHEARGAPRQAFDQVAARLEGALRESLRIDRLIT